MAIPPAQAYRDSTKEQKIAEAIGRTLKPCSARRFRKFDSRQHSVHFVEQSGNVEKEGAEYRPRVRALSKSDTRQNGDHNSAERDGVGRHRSVRKESYEWPAEPAIE